MKSINIAQAKKISIVAYLAQMGHKSVKFEGGQHLYRSPFRDEKKGSFYVKDNAGKDGEDLWFDYGLGGDAGGDIIRLAQLLHNFSSVSETLTHLADYSSEYFIKKINPSFNQQSIFDTNNSKIEIVGSPMPLNHFVLLKYLREVRKIPDHISQRYLSMVYYTHDKAQGKKYFAFAWLNQSGAYEIRGAGEKSFKSISGRKDITVIPYIGQSHKAFIFEGMLDFLSALAMKKTSSLDGIVIILNGSALVKRILPILENKSIEIIHSFMDNDTAGRQATNRIIELFHDTEVIVHTFYHEYKDVNEYWVEYENLSS